jgi:hypothetical protein
MVGKHVLAVQRLATDAVTGEVVSALRAREIPVVLFKGPVIERWLYTDGTRRDYGDIDLLVPPDRFGSAQELLSELGFRMAADSWRRFEFRDDEHEWTRGGFSIDLHRGVWGFAADQAVVWATLTSDLDVIEIGGAAVPVPVPAAQALMIAVHAVQHGGRGQPLEDLRRALATADDSTWREAAELAKRSGSLAPFTLALSRLDPGPRLLERLALEASADAATHLRAGGAPDGSVTMLRLAEERDVRERVSLLAAKLAPSPHFLRFKYPIARRGRFGLLAGYAWHPLWMCSRVPSAWRAWRGAEAAARKS